MTRYFVTVLAYNILFALLVHKRLNHTGLSKWGFIFISVVSLIISTAFPYLAAQYSLLSVLVINLTIVGAGTFFIARQEGINKFSRETEPEEEEEPKKEGKNIKEEEAVEALTEFNQAEKQEPKFESLDSYILKGFESKDTGDLTGAVNNFLSAMELNPPLDLKIMLAFDIVTMMRELGDYYKAKNFLSKFMKDNYDLLDPSVICNIDFNLKQIELLIEELRDVNKPNLPFSLIPPSILARVNKRIETL